MKKKIFGICVLAAILSGCSSAYKTSQTPDDVYYSPGRSVSAGNNDEYMDYTSSSDDQYLRMKVQNRSQWAPIDDYSYWYDSRYYTPGYYNPYGGYYYNPYSYHSPYSYYSPFGYSSYGYGYYSPYSGFGYNPWCSWNYPYYTVVYYKNPGVYYGTNNRTTLGGYNNGTYNNTNNNLLLPRSNSTNINTYNTTTTGRQSKYSNSNTISNTSTRPVRTFNSENKINTPRSNGGFKNSGSNSTAPRTPKHGGGGF